MKCFFSGAASAVALLAAPAFAQGMPAMDTMDTMDTMDMGQDAHADHGAHQGHAMPGETSPPPPDSAPAPAGTDAATMPDMPDMPGMDGAAMPGHGDHGTHGLAMQAGQGMTGMGEGPFANGSGTSRLPGQEAMAGLHLMRGDWMLMAHGYVWGVYSNQGGPRGADKAFAASMAMLQAQHPLGSGARITLRSMLSLDPLMGDRGYPNLFATGETAGGRPLVDRQHPHDAFMELAARIDVDVAPGTSLFVYGGPVGEPAIGPSAFMHRASSRLNPEAPIGHHWFDSTHITYGVVTVGLSAPRWQFEASAFRGREPDEQRWDIEAPKLDSWAVRASWTPTPRWAAQISYARIESPEALHPGEDEARLTASLSYAAGPLAVTIGYSRKDRLPGPVLDAWLAEANWDVTDRHALFGRIEAVKNDELFGEDSPLHDRPFRVAKFTLGYGYTIPLGKLTSLALGGSGSVYAKPGSLDAAYGRSPKSFTLFAKLALGR